MNTGGVGKVATQTIFVLDQDAKDDIKALHVKIDRLTALMLGKDAVKRRSLDFEESSVSVYLGGGGENPLLTAGDFCEKYQLNRKTLLKESREGKYIERIQLGPRNFRYRLKTDESKGAKGGDRQEKTSATF